MQQTAETVARLSLKVDPKAAQEMAELARQTGKAAEQEERLNRAAKETLRTRTEGARAVNAATGAGGAGPGAGGAGPGATSPAAPSGPSHAATLTDLDRAVLARSQQMQAAREKAARERQIDARLRELGEKPSRFREGLASAEELMLSRFGLGGSGAGLALGGLAGVSAVTYGGFSAGINAARISADPFASERMKAQRQLYSAPFGVGYATSFGRDIARAELFSRSGEGEYEAQFGRLSRRIAEQGATAGSRSELENVYNTLGMAQQGARNRADVFGGFELQGRGSTRRDTVADRIRYLEEGQILPAKQAQAKASKELAAQERNLSDVEAKRGRLAMEAQELDRKAFELRQERVKAEAGDGSARFMLFGDTRNEQAGITARLSDVQREQERVANERRAADEQLRAAREGVAGARSASRQAGIGVTEAELGVLRERESTARGQARALGAAGPAGRMQAQIALQTLRQMGVENAPPELMGQAASLFPQEVAAMQERAGRGLAGQFRAVAPGEYRDDVGDISRQVNVAEEDVRKRKGTDLEQFAGDVADSFEGLIESMKTLLLDVIEHQKQKLEADKFAESANQ